MKVYEVVVTDTALEALRKQAEYIAVEQQAPQTASKWLKRVLEKSESLASMPRRYPRALEDRYRAYEIRALVVSSFVLLFTIDEDAQKVVVIGARHGKSLPRPEQLPDD